MNDEWMNNEWMMKTDDCVTHHLFNCICSSLVYVWTLRPTAPKRSLRNIYLSSFKSQRPLSFRRLFIFKDLMFVHKKVFHIKDLFMSFIWPRFHWPGDNNISNTLNNITIWLKLFIIHIIQQESPYNLP